MVPQPSQIIVTVYNQITLLILYYISSRLVIHLESFMPLHKYLIFFVLLLVSSSLILVFRHSFFIPEMSASFTSYIV